MNEKISVIVPIYKVEAYLKKCVESICHQTYQNLEIILVDDDSPDRCGEMCDELAAGDSRIIVLHKENRGLSSARNAGLEVATGNYISFVDSDDFVAENFLEVLYHLCKKYDCKLAQCGYSRNQDEKTEQVSIAQEKVYESWQSYLLSSDCVVAVWNKLYARELFDTTRFLEGRLYEDLAITYQLVYRQEKIVVINEGLYYYIEREGSIMHREFSLHNMDTIITFEEQMIFFEKHKEKNLLENARKRYCYSILQCICGLRRYVKDSKPIQKELRAKYKIHSKQVLGDDSTPYPVKVIIALGGVFPSSYDKAMWLADKLGIFKAGKRQEFFNRFKFKLKLIK